MGPRCLDAAVTDHDYPVCVRHGGEAVCDHDEGPACHQLRDGSFYLRLALGVRIGRGLVQDHDGCVVQHGARDGDALALAAREVTAASPDHRLVPMIKPLDELVAAALTRGLDDLLVARLGMPHADVFHDCLVKEVVVLGHVGNKIAQLPGRHAFERHAT